MWLDNTVSTLYLKKIAMNKFYITLIFTLLSFSLANIFAQQDAQYTQYMYNTTVVNPAYAGTRGVLSINALHRSQWVGFDGAPKSQTFSAHAPLTQRLGGGFSIVNDDIGNGTNQNTYVNAQASYTIPTSTLGKLSFGLNAGAHMLNINLNQLQNYRPDLNFTGQNQNNRKFSPNFGLGLYYHTNRFYGGVSIPNILETNLFDEDADSFISKQRFNFYAIAGYVFEFSPYLKFKPATLVKAVRGAPLQIDVSANFLINEKFTLGGAYRWDAALSFLTGFQISDQFMVGFSYDKETTELGATTYNDGSFEVLLRYEFLYKYKKVKSSRFF